MRSNKQQMQPNHPKQQHLIFGEEKVTAWQVKHWLPVDNNQHVIASLKATQFMDSTSLNSLFKAHQILASRGKQLILISPSAPIRTLLYFTQLAEWITVFSRIQDALDYLRAEENER